MAAAQILECFQQEDKWFTGVVMTDGRGSPRQGLYKDYTDEAMRLVRLTEQKKAAMIGAYSRGRYETSAIISSGVGNRVSFFIA